jgi:recombination protein RecT
MTQPTSQTAAAPKGLTTTRQSGPRDPQTEFRDTLMKLRPQIMAALPQHIKPDHMLRLVLTAVRRTPALLTCSRESVLAAIMQAAQLGLEPDSSLGHVYLLPFGNQCQLIIGWKGLIELARRSGLVSNITAHCVHYGDFFEYELGLDTKLRHIPADVLDMPQYARERAIADDMRREQVVGALAGNSKSDLVAAYAVVTMKDGTRQFRVVTRKLVERIRSMSQSRNSSSSPWTQWEEQMWEKTAVKQALRFVPLSPEDKTIIEHADVGRVLGKIGDVKTIQALEDEPLPPEATGDPEAPSGETPAAAPAPAAPHAQPAAPAPRQRRKAQPITTPAEDAISGAPAAAAPPVTPPPREPVAPPPGPPPPTDGDDQPGLFGDGATDDPGPGPDASLALGFRISALTMKGGGG